MTEGREALPAERDLRQKLDSWRVIVAFGVVYAASQAIIIHTVRHRALQRRRRA